jgi:hypothetical protein
MLAIITKANPASPEYKFLKKRETEDLKLSGLRREFLKILLELYLKCFRPTLKGDHILPLLDSKTISPYYRKVLIKACETLFAEAICSHIFNNVQQLIFGQVVLSVPNIKGN